MNRSSRLASAFLAAALTAGVGAPAATAAHPDSKGQRAVSDKSATQKVLRKIENLDKRLAKVAKEARTSKLNEADRLALTGNIASDREILIDLAATVVDADTAKAAAVYVKQVRPANYTATINHLRWAKRLAAEVSDAAATVEPGSVEEAALIEAGERIASATAAAYLITATSYNGDLKAVFMSLMYAKSLLDTVVVEDDTETP